MTDPRTDHTAENEPMQHSDNEPRRDPAGTLVGVLGAAVLSALALWLAFLHAWWTTLLAVVCAVAVVVFIYGAAESVGRARRDHRGIRR